MHKIREKQKKNREKHIKNTYIFCIYILLEKASHSSATTVPKNGLG